MRITVLGKSPAWQDADGACSGYLVEGGGQVVLLDCGPGVFAKLRRFVDYLDVDAVVISHLHADHILDLVPYASGLRYAPRAQTRTSAPSRCSRRPARRTRSRRCARRGNMTADHIELAFDLTVYDPAQTLRLGGLDVRFQPVPHYIPANAVEFADDGARFTFSSDCGPSDALCEFAAATDLLLIEATLPRAEGDEERGHLTPEEAGEHGAKAGARRLVLTHFSDELDARLGASRGRTGLRAAGRRGPRRCDLRRSASSKGRAQGRSLRPIAYRCDPCHRRHGWRATALAPSVSALQGRAPRQRARRGRYRRGGADRGRSGLGRAPEVRGQVAHDLRARLPVRDPPGRRAEPAGPGRDAARPHAHGLVPRIPLARAHAPALPADRRAGRPASPTAARR